jgi:hypothetical protein
LWFQISRQLKAATAGIGTIRPVKTCVHKILVNKTMIVYGILGIIRKCFSNYDTQIANRRDMMVFSIYCDKVDYFRKARLAVLLMHA